MTVKTYPTCHLEGTAARTGVLTAVLAGAVDAALITELVETDNLPRAYRKPVMLYGVRFDSVTTAARSLDQHDHAFVECQRTHISRICNAGGNKDIYFCE